MDTGTIPPQIHPTAVIDSGASIGSDCHIGPYCVIGAGVELGDGCRLHSHVVLLGPSVIGPRNQFFPYACVGGLSQDLKYAGEPTGLRIGGDNVFREFTTVHRSTVANEETVIGSHNHFLAYSHVAHDCRVGDYVISSNNGTLAGHVTVEDHAVIGGLTAIHQFCRIGRHAITGGCSKIVQDVPPFMIADGNPAVVRGVNKVGLQRRGFSDEEVRALRQCHRWLYRKEVNIAQALENIEGEDLTGHECVRQLVEFIRGSQRGIIR